MARSDATAGHLELAGRRGFTVASVTLFLLVAQSGAPSPLFPLYQQRMGLSDAGITGIFSIYIVGLLASLLTVGSLSDHLGRRPVILASTALSIVALAVFSTAGGLPQLLIARVLQGIAVGAGMSAAGAAMIDLEPPTRSTLAAVLNGAIPPAGLALGALGSSALLQYAPGPTVTTYLVLGALIAAAGILCGFLSDTRPRQRVALATLRPRISLPRPTRPVFVAVIGSMISSWALGGLYLALGPTILIRSQHIGNHLAAGGFVATVTGVGALTGLVTRKLSARKAIVIGTSALIIGPVLTCVAIFTGSTWGLFGSSVIAGIGFGAGFQAGLRMILTETPEMARAGVLSTTYLVSYTAFGLPAVVAGFLVPFAGLVPVVTGYAAFVALTAAAALVLQAAVPSSRVAEFAAQQSRAPTS